MRLIKSLNIDELSERHISWIYEHLRGDERYIEDIELKRASIKDHISSEATHSRVSDLLYRSKLHLLPDEELAWIDEHNYRLLRWIGFYCASPEPNIPGWIPTLTYIPITDYLRYQSFISALDNWNAELYEKRLVIEKVRIAWSNVLLKDSKLAWLIEGDQNQMDWAWEYMLSERAVPYFLTPTNAEEKYSNIMSVFDCWQGTPEKLQLLQLKMNRAWAQQKYRANLKNKKKKQSTYALSMEAKSQLQILAKKSNVNLNQMLEYIIDQAFKNHKKEKTDD